MLTPEQARSDRANLHSSLASLAGLVSSTLGLPLLLERVASFAVHGIPGADGAGVTLLCADRDDNQVDTLAASDPFVADIDHIQYVVVNEGPCITAALVRRTVCSGSLGGERQWPHFGPRVGRLGVHSVMSLPLLLRDQVVGAIDVYARAKNVFDDHAVELGELFAAPAAVTVHNAQVLARALLVTTQLQSALSSRPVIDQAVGLLLGRSGGSPEEAFARLRSISQSENTKLVSVAERLVDEAVRRARARRQP